MAALALDHGDVRIWHGDVIDCLENLPAESVQTCVTSPPYWGLRDYGADDQIGLESTPEAYVTRLVDVFREVRRVLRDDGTLWLNLGDSYAHTTTFIKPHTGVDFVAPGSRGTGVNVQVKAVDGLKPKDLVGIPWRVAFALQADGWYLRSDIIWAKPNPMPESVTDRPTKAHEYIFLLSKSQRYFYDAEAIREQSVKNEWWGIGPQHSAARNRQESYELMEVREGRNARSVWTIPTRPYPAAHFATFPTELPERCIKAGSREGDTVLDPFMGSGTTAWVARHIGRHAIGCELNADYIQLAAQRLQQQSLLA